MVSLLCFGERRTECVERRCYWAVIAAHDEVKRIGELDKEGVCVAYLLLPSCCCHALHRNSVLEESLNILIDGDGSNIPPCLSICNSLVDGRTRFVTETYGKIHRSLAHRNIHVPGIATPRSQDDEERKGC